MNNPIIPTVISREVRILDKKKQLNIPLIEEISKILHNSGNVYLYGPLFSGKSIIAAATLMKAVEGKWVAPWSKMEFITSIQYIEDSTPNPGSNFSTKEYLKRLQNEIDWLVLDDVGTERLSDFAYSRLHLLIEGRLNWARPTIFTSNHDIRQLCASFPTDRLAWRLEKYCTTIHMTREAPNDQPPG